MKILIIGATGQLGSELKKSLEAGTCELGVVPKAYKGSRIESVSSKELNICNINAVRVYINSSKPDIIFNCAAYTNVDGCETNIEEAFKVNAIGARNIAIAAELIKAKLVHLSTDYVFSGDGVKPHCEYDMPNPQSIYGKSKYLGENYVREFCSRYFIVRTAWLYGYTGKNFVKTILKAGRDRDELTVVNDQRGNPTNAVDLTYHLLKLAASVEYGIYHCVGIGECSWYDFASKIIEYASIDATVTPCSTQGYPSQTKRPAYSVLDNMMLRCTVGDEMRGWQDALKSFIGNYKHEQI